MRTAGPAETKAEQAVGPRRRRLLTVFGVLVAVSLGFDYSIYVGGITHVYVHELATLVAGIVGIRVALQLRSLLPAQRATRVLLALLGLLVANTVLLGAIEYHAVPVAMHKLFWFEHGDAIRILAELAVWVWLFGLIDPQPDEIWSIFDIALWGGVVAVVLDSGFWLVRQVVHLETTTFDLTVMVGLPLSAVFVIRRAARSDVIRLGIYGAGSILLYSRAALVVVVLTVGFMLVTLRKWRPTASILGPVVAGWIAVLVMTLAVGAAPALAGVARLGAPPGANGATVTGNSVTATLLRLLSLGDTQIAGYTIPSRTRIWRDALSIAKKDPFLGVGYHDYFAFSTVSEIKAGSDPNAGGLFPDLIKAAHNDYLSMLVETGVPGLLLYLAFWLLVIGGAAKLWWEKPDRLRHAFLLGFLLSFAAVSFTGEFLIPRSPIWLGPATLWWLLIATLLLEVDRRFGWLKWPRR